MPPLLFLTLNYIGTERLSCGRILQTFEPEVSPRIRSRYSCCIFVQNLQINQKIPQKNLPLEFYLEISSGVTPEISGGDLSRFFPGISTETLSIWGFLLECFPSFKFFHGFLLSISPGIPFEVRMGNLKEFHCGNLFWNSKRNCWKISKRNSRQIPRRNSYATLTRNNRRMDD